jgi:hypothetical protein
VIAQRATMRPRGMTMALKVISPWDVGNCLCRLTDGKINLEDDDDGGKTHVKELFKHRSVSASAFGTRHG